MGTKINPFAKFSLKFFPAFIVCFILSFLYSDSRVSSFDISSSVLQFIFEGILSALFFALLETVSLRIAIIAFILLALFSQPYILLPADLSLYVRKVMFNAAGGASIYLYWKYSSDNGKVFWNRILQLAGYMGITYLIASNIWQFIYMSNPSVFSGLLARGFILGLGLGIGFEIGNYIINKINDSNEMSGEKLKTEK